MGNSPSRNNEYINNVSANNNNSNNNGNAGSTGLDDGSNAESLDPDDRKCISSVNDNLKSKSDNFRNHDEHKHTSENKSKSKSKSKSKNRDKDQDKNSSLNASNRASKKNLIGGYSTTAHSKSDNIDIKGTITKSGVSSSFSNEKKKSKKTHGLINDLYAGGTPYKQQLQTYKSSGKSSSSTGGGKKHKKSFGVGSNGYYSTTTNNINININNSSTPTSPNMKTNDFEVDLEMAKAFSNYNFNLNNNNHNIDNIDNSVSALGSENNTSSYSSGTNDDDDDDDDEEYDDDDDEGIFEGEGELEKRKKGTKNAAPINSLERPSVVSKLRAGSNGSTSSSSSEGSTSTIESALSTASTSSESNSESHSDSTDSTACGSTVSASLDSGGNMAHVSSLNGVKGEVQGAESNAIKNGKSADAVIDGTDSSPDSPISPVSSSIMSHTSNATTTAVPSSSPSSVSSNDSSNHSYHVLSAKNVANLPPIDEESLKDKDDVENLTKSATTLNATNSNGSTEGQPMLLQRRKSSSSTSKYLNGLKNLSSSPTLIPVASHLSDLSVSKHSSRSKSHGSTSIPASASTPSSSSSSSSSTSSSMRHSHKHKSKKPNADYLNVDECIEKLLVLGDLREYKSKSFPFELWEIQLICSRAREIFLSEPSLLKLKAPIKVVGDVHGQYQDLLRVLKLSGYPGKTGYLFLGDYVDRGKQSLETILLLLLFKIKFPKSFFMLRGNHESANITKMYGFYDECKRRTRTSKTWKNFIDCFNTLPLAATINDKIFCVHGGLSPDLHDFHQINKIARPTDIPENGLLTDLLWSDPDSNVSDWCSNNDRGVSYAFSKKNILEFCDNFNIELIIRGHMVVEDGYEFFARKKFVTIFSAPNYCGEFNNWGAVMSVTNNLTCSFELLKPKLHTSKSSGGSKGKRR